MKYGCSSTGLGFSSRLDIEFAFFLASLPTGGANRASISDMTDPEPGSRSSPGTEPEFGPDAGARTGSEMEPSAGEVAPPLPDMMMDKLFELFLVVHFFLFVN